MEMIGNNFILGLVGEVSTLVSKGSRRSLLKHQASVTKLLDMIDMVRQHRSLTHQFLFNHQQEVVEKVAALDEEMKKAITKLASDRYVGNSIERIALKNKLTQLTSSYKERSISNNLVAHGKVIRQLIFQIDSQILISLDKADKLELAGEYNDQWQAVMSGIEALTQYRLSIMAMNMNLKPALLAKQANVLYSKLVKVSDVYSDYHPDLNECMTQLERYLTEHKHTEEYQAKLFDLSSEISAALVDVYEAIIEKTFAKAISGVYSAE